MKIIPITGICTDASHLTKTKVTEYRGVITETGEEIFRELVPFSSVNVGEFMGLVHGIMWIIENDPEDRVLWTDSATAITWYKNRQSASSVRLPEMLMADVFLQAFEHELETIEVKHWNKRDIGMEIPADFGRK